MESNGSGTTPTTTTTTTHAPSEQRLVNRRGRCPSHPHVILRKKSIMGVVGRWRDVLPFCPKCKAEDEAGAERVAKVDATDISREAGVGAGSYTTLASALLVESMNLYNSGDYTGDDHGERIEYYTAAIPLVRMNCRRVDALMNSGVVSSKHERVTTQIKEIHVRCLLRRSEAYLALKKYHDAYVDASEAFTAASLGGLLRSDVQWAESLVDRTMAGVLGMDDHTHLDNLQRARARYMLENPQEPIQFVPGSCGTIMHNAELQLEGKQDDVSMLTPCTDYPQSSGEITIGSIETAWRPQQLGSGPARLETTPTYSRFDANEECYESLLVRELKETPFQHLRLDANDDGGVRLSDEAMRLTDEAIRLSQGNESLFECRLKEIGALDKSGR